MKGKLAETVKKWWMIALVATLALSLTSCGRRRTNLLSGGLVCGDNNVSVVYGVFPLDRNQMEIVVLPQWVSLNTGVDTLEFVVLDDWDNEIAWGDNYIENQQPASETSLVVPRDISNPRLVIDYINGTNNSVVGSVECSLPLGGNY